MPTHHNPRSKQTNQAPLRTGPSHVDLRLPSCTTAQSQAETDRARADLTGTQLSGVDLIGTILFNVNPADVEDLPASNSARQTLPRNHSPENVRGGCRSGRDEPCRRRRLPPLLSTSAGSDINHGRAHTFPTPTRIHTEADPTRTVRFDAQHREHEAMNPKRTYITSAPPG